MMVVIPCGGKGRRLGLTGMQKCLAPCGDRPFLHWRMHQLAMVGATEFLLLIAAHAESVWLATGDTFEDIPVRYLVDSQRIRAPWDAVRAATRNYYIPIPDEFHVALGDVWTDLPLLDSVGMWVTTNSPHEPYNVEDKYLDAGLYRVEKRMPVPPLDQLRLTDKRTYQLNTKESWKEAEAHLCGSL